MIEDLDGDVMYTRADAHRQRGEVVQAEKWLRRAVRCGHVQAKTELTRLLRELGRNDEAKQVLPHCDPNG